MATTKRWGLVAVDPSENVLGNPYAHRVEQKFIEDFHCDDRFDLATLRMVAEHVEDPDSVARTLSRFVIRGGRVIIFTVSLWAPITIISRIVPFSLHFKIKRLVWGGEDRDTFPACYRMNSRKTLRELFENNGFEEESFAALDDLSATVRFDSMHLIDIMIWKGLNAFGIPYPEKCLLGVYRKK